MATMPIVSVVIPTFGRPVLLERAIRSVLAQTFSDLEVVVVVDGFDQPTTDAIDNIRDERLRYSINTKKLGAGLARDRGVAIATGQWVAFLDDDDEWHPGKIRRQLAAISDEKTISMTLYRVVSRDGERISPTRPYDGAMPIDEWLFGRHSWLKPSESMLQTSALMMPRILFDTIGFGTARHEEWELVIRAVKQLEYKLVTVNEPLVTYYAGNLYKWRSSVEWVDSVRNLLTPKAYAGFCLTVATQGLEGPERGIAIRTFLAKALRYGRPTTKQLFAFLLIWAIPDYLRHRLRASIQNLRAD